MQDYKIEYIVKKLSILAITSVVSSILLFILFRIIQMVSYGFICIDLIINNVCIMLTFKSLDHLFKHVCCCFARWYNKKNIQIQLSKHVNDSANSN